MSNQPYYAIVKVPPRQPGTIATHAFRNCWVCGCGVDGHNGPGRMFLCEDCLEYIRDLRLPPLAA